MHCQSAFLHLQGLANGPVVEQVKCRVQLQHRSTVSQAHRLRRLTVETIPNPPYEFLPSVFSLSMAWPPSLILKRRQP